MKKMTCKQLGGACELEFEADTFEEMAELSRQHGMEMHGQNDAAHLAARAQMRELMQSSEDMSNWMESKRRAFDSLPDSADGDN